MECTKKEIIQLFKSNNLSITIDTNMQQVNFLDITLNLTSCKYSPYRKPNDQLLYIHKDSNHPPTIKRQLPTMIQQQISDLLPKVNSTHQKKQFIAFVSKYFLQHHKLRTYSIGTQ